MNGRTREAVDERYERSFGVRAGYLPRDRSVIDKWHADLKRDLDRASATRLQPSVKQFAALLERDPIIRMYVTEMLSQAAVLRTQHGAPAGIDTPDELIAALNKLVKTSPVFGGIHFPMSALFAYMMMTPAGEAVFRNADFNAALVLILREWCRFLDSKASRPVLNKRNGWLSAAAVKELSLGDYVYPDKKDPYGGFTSWNEFFHRQIKPAKRPVSDPDDPAVVVSANDGHVYNFASNVKAHDEFWAKGQAFSLADMLNSRHLDRFIKRGTGGDVIQSFLSGNDYHRFVAPIAGTVVGADIVPGLMFSNAESAGFDPNAGVLSQGYEVSVNTRALIFIESDEPRIGMVCVIPIGITEVSSIKLVVEEGDRLKKGDELGWFSFGGSTLCLVFEPGVIDYYTLRAPVVDDPHAGPAGSVDSIIRARERLAIVRRAPR
jgi:phosphatidylserine decarboxylase